MNRTAAWALLPLLAGPAAAADPAAPDTALYRVPVTVITATRSVDRAADLPASVSAVTGNEIGRGEKGLSVAEALSQVPGLMAADRNNLSLGPRLTVRGLGARAAFGVRGVKVVLDGIPLTAADGQTALDNIDLGSAGRIEVLRGPSSSLYGNAGGGVLSIATEEPGGGLRVRPRLVVGSDGLWHAQASVSGATARHRYVVAVHRFAQDGYRRHAESRAGGVNAVNRARLTEGLELTAVANLYDAPYLLNPSSLSRQDARARPRHARDPVVQQGASKRARQGQMGLTLRHAAADSARSEVTVYGVKRSLLNPIPGSIVDLDRNGGGLRAVHERRLRVGGVPLRWKVGLDVEVQSDRRAEYGNDGLADPAVDAADVLDEVRRGALQLKQDEEVRGTAPFAAVDLCPHPDLLLTLGGRYDRYRFEAQDRFLDDGDDSGQRRLGQLSPAAGASLRLTPRTTLYAGYGTAFQTPTASELSNRPDGSGGFNPQLDAERIGSFEVGARGHWPRARLDCDAALYRMAVDDMLLPFQSADPASEAVYYRNAGRTASRGAEVALRARPLAALQASLSYTYMDFTFDDYAVETDGALVQLAGNRVPGLPPHRLALDLTWTWRRAWAELQAQTVDGYWANDFNGPPPGSATPREGFFNDGYATLDLRFGVPLAVGGQAATLFAGVDNLLGERYNGSITPNAFGARFFEPAPGRTWHAGVEARVGP